MSTSICTGIREVGREKTDRIASPREERSINQRLYEMNKCNYTEVTSINCSVERDRTVR